MALGTHLDHVWQTLCQVRTENLRVQNRAEQRTCAVIVSSTTPISVATELRVVPFVLYGISDAFCQHKSWTSDLIFGARVLEILVDRLLNIVVVVLAVSASFYGSCVCSRYLQSPARNISWHKRARDSDQLLDILFCGLARHRRGLEYMLNDLSRIDAEWGYCV